MKLAVRFELIGILAAIVFAPGALPSDTPATEQAVQQIISGVPVIQKLKPERKAGRGYKLIYFIDAPLDVVWRFKTDFGNQVLLSNKYINSHRLVSRNQNEAVTATEYSNKPKFRFEWQTIQFPDQHLLDFILLNPEECGQKYHYGYIQLEAMGTGTRVTQIAYFDFFGVSLWVSYPFKGGMSYFLKYTAAWEQKAVLDSIRVNMR